jgi:hypothetical protein
MKRLSFGSLLMLLSLSPSCLRSGDISASLVGKYTGNRGKDEIELRADGYYFARPADGKILPNYGWKNR